MPYIGQAPTQAAFVTDTFSGNGSTTAFTMSVAPAGTTSVLVAVSGVLQDPSTYSVTGTTLTFSGAPPTGTGNISARYLGIPASGVTTTAYRTVTEFTATANQKTFTPPSYTVGFINVYRNGVLLGSADYVATNGTTVVLTTGATSGDLVTVESFLVSSVLNAIPATTGSVGSTYLAGGAVLQANLGTNVAGNGPAFSVYASAGQTISASTTAKVNYGTVDFDTNSNFNTSTATFTPTVAGYYQINGFALGNNSSVAGGYSIYIYKNGGNWKRGTNITTGSTANVSLQVNDIIYMNGTTDYVQIYVANSTGSTWTLSTGTRDLTYFSGAMVRAA